MTLNTFLKDLQDLLQTEAELSADSSLRAVEEWDSVSQMALMAYYDQCCGKRIDFKTISECVSVFQLVEIAGDSIS